MKARAVAALAVAGAGYAGLQRLGRTQGATPAEPWRGLPGDERCADPQAVTTHAVTVQAPPEAVWPWLAQMGWGRGQWYAARWVDRLLLPANGPRATAPPGSAATPGLSLPPGPGREGTATGASLPDPLAPAGLDLYWIPLGAGERVVRISGRTYEALAALVQRRPRCDLYHSALVASTAEGRFVVEMTPVPAGGPAERGVVAEGPVGTRWARPFRIFRYEIRRWRDGVIPDLAYAVDGPVRVADDPVVVRHVLDLVPFVPTLVWGRDELGAGDMWNSNSVVAWVLTRAGAGAGAGRPPGHGRAPGWHAGVVAARRCTVRRPPQPGA